MYGGNGHFQYSKAGKQELRCMCSARRLMVCNICVQFHENMSNGFNVMERTRKMLKDTHTRAHTYTEKRRKLYTPLHTSYAGGITRDMVHVFCMSSHGLPFV